MSLDFFRSVRLLLSIKLISAFLLTNVCFYAAAASDAYPVRGTLPKLTAKPIDASLTGKIFDSVLVLENGSDGRVNLQKQADGYAAPDVLQGDRHCAPYLQLPASGLRKACPGKWKQRLFAIHCAWKIPADRHC